MVLESQRLWMPGARAAGPMNDTGPGIRASKLAVCPYIHVSTGALSSLPEAMEDVDPHHMDAEGIRELFRWYGNELAGLKIRISRNIVGDLGLDPLKRAVEIAELTGVPLMVHITDPPAPIEEVLSSGLGISLPICIRTPDQRSWIAAPSWTP